MKTKTKVWLMIAILFIFGGALLAGTGYALGGTFNYSYFFKDGRLNFSDGSGEYVSATVTVSDFSKLNVTSGTIDVNVIQGGDTCTVSYYVPEDRVPRIDDGNTLVIDVPDSHGFFFNFMNFGSDQSPYITINVPSTDEKKFDIDSSTGDITVENMQFSGTIETSTGDVIIRKGNLGNISIETSTGDIYINDIVAPETKISTSTGETFIDNCRIENLTNRASTGDITIKNSELGSFKADGSTSDVTVVSSRINDVKIDVSTGECELSLIGSASDYSCKLNTSTGDLNYNGDSFKKSYTHTSSGSGSIEISTSTGDIDVIFR